MELNCLIKQTKFDENPPFWKTRPIQHSRNPEVVLLGRDLVSGFGDTIPDWHNLGLRRERAWPERWKVDARCKSMTCPNPESAPSGCRLAVHWKGAMVAKNESTTNVTFASYGGVGARVLAMGTHKQAVASLGPCGYRVLGNDKLPQVGTAQN